MKNTLTVALIIISSLLFAQKTVAERTKHLNIEKGIAIQQYDPVAYFASKKPAKGNSKYVVKYLGIDYYFSSEANKKTFLENPSKYEPQYGGWCAYAMGDSGKEVQIDPETFKIIDGKLYLFYNAYFYNTLKSWNKDEKNLKVKADKNWLNLIK